ncbi:hypothetical protein GDO78_016811 [Eleutherodactylus coqui]|uniref:Uncharacterized protein n=1 Tax=Eleutherodactylus coqui TaxID=57060 RepID=A0A8J6BAT6_ELECQ|nr:hypothetical protein GDO78_016811 [Eleutherodactylus coqui]
MGVALNHVTSQRCTSNSRKTTPSMLCSLYGMLGFVSLTFRGHRLQRWAECDVRVQPRQGTDYPVRCHCGCGYGVWRW